MAVKRTKCVVTYYLLIVGLLFGLSFILGNGFIKVGISPTFIGTRKLKFVMANYSLFI